MYKRNEAKIDKLWEGQQTNLLNSKNTCFDKNLISRDQEPNVRLIRDYVSRGIISKPRKEGKEVVFGYIQLIEFLACRTLINDGWPLKKIANDFQKSTIDEIKLIIPGETPENDSMRLIKSFGKRGKMRNISSTQSVKASSANEESPQRSRSGRLLNFIRSKSFLKSGYRPSDDEPFMNEDQIAYFRNKLLDWKKSVLSESKGIQREMKGETRNIPDLADRASEEKDRALELRIRDRQRKLISKIDAALRKIEDGSYGYCEETGEPISLKRLDARHCSSVEATGGTRKGKIT